MATYLLLVTLCITNEPPDGRWRRPVQVLGKDGQQVLVKHGGTYARCYLVASH